MLPIQEKVTREWWIEWARSYFPSLVLRTKWTREVLNAKIGDMALLKYSSKFADPSFRLGRVSCVRKDVEGVVRTCQITMRPKDRGSQSLSK